MLTFSSEDDNDNDNKMVVEPPVIRTTIRRVTKTSVLRVKMRGKEWEIEQPEIGSIVVSRDNGYSNAIDYTKSFVVTSRRVNKSGVVTSIGVSSILEITDDTVTFDDNCKGKTGSISIYTNNGYARWSDHPSHSLHFYTWDKYMEYNAGDHSK
jgi:hypothetical protein